MRCFHPLVLLSVLAVLGCGPRARRTAQPPHLSLQQLADEGALPASALPGLLRLPTRDFRQEIRIAIRDDVSGKGFEGRGALAVRPRHALRMILLGPGGTTAMDVWMRDGRFRVSIPALDRLVRGDEHTPSEKLREMPIALLQRWLVAPFGGKTVAAHSGRVEGSGEVTDDRASFVVFQRRGRTFEARARARVGGHIEASVWWFEQGRLTAFLTGREQAMGESEDAPIVPAEARYIGFDPAMTVEVHAASTSFVDLPPATFADPDGESALE